jgi:hypothetical protein
MSLGRIGLGFLVVSGDKRRIGLLVVSGDKGCSAFQVSEVGWFKSMENVSLSVGSQFCKWF